MFVFVFVCLFICLSFCVYVSACLFCLSVCLLYARPLSVCLCMYCLRSSVFVWTCLNVYPSVSLSVYMFVCSACCSVCVCVCLTANSTRVTSASLLLNVSASIFVRLPLYLCLLVCVICVMLFSICISGSVNCISRRVVDAVWPSWVTFADVRDRMRPRRHANLSDDKTRRDTWHCSLARWLIDWVRRERECRFMRIVKQSGRKKLYAETKWLTREGIRTPPLPILSNFLVTLLSSF